MWSIIDTDRAMNVVTYVLSTLAIYWGCKRSVAVSPISPLIPGKLAVLIIQSDSPIDSSRDHSVRHGSLQRSPTPSESRSSRCIFAVGVILAVGLIGVLAHLIVHLTSRGFQNWLSAIAAVGQITIAMSKVSPRFSLTYIGCRFQTDGRSSLDR
jgi:hypothetical protein